ncbi:hypothetical protein ACH5RR_018518 [Cinchona calisaya]|uniref:Uncharacterized protein n=1 Tax=Cinchona calisaya TaxID=153742 RepID=A0ABD2ZMK4_9GENT
MLEVGNLKSYPREVTLKIEIRIGFLKWMCLTEGHQILYNSMNHQCRGLNFAFIDISIPQKPKVTTNDRSCQCREISIQLSQCQDEPRLHSLANVDARLSRQSQGSAKCFQIVPMKLQSIK